MLAMMQLEQTREIAQNFVGAVPRRLDGVSFCPDERGRAQLAFSAVRTYLDSNLAKLYRSPQCRIIQGLRQAYPCSQR